MYYKNVYFLRMLNWPLWKRFAVSIFLVKIEEDFYHDRPDRTAGAIKLRFKIEFSDKVKKENRSISKIRSGSFGRLRKICSKWAKKIMNEQTGLHYIVINNHAHEDQNVFDVIILPVKKSKPLYSHQYMK